MEDKELKYFANNDGAGNFDDADFIVGSNEWVNMENARTGSTDKGVTGTVESIGGTLLLSTIQPSATFINLGSAEEEERSRFCHFKFNTTGINHKIVCFDTIANVEYDVLLASQVTGGLGFNKNYPIHSAFIVNGMLYWTDNLNQLRRVNIDAGIKLNNPSYVTTQAAYTTPIEQWVISTIRRPTGLAPTVVKFDNGNPTNFTKYLAVRFAFRYFYRDFETSVIGDYSVLMNRNLDSETYNQFNINMLRAEYIEQDVQIVELVMQDAETEECFVIKTWDKDIPSQLAEINSHNAGGTQLGYNFLNDIAGIAISKTEALKQYDDVPIYAKTISLADNRQFVANGVHGYSSPISTSLAVSAITTTGGSTGTYDIKTITVTIYGTTGGGAGYNYYTSAATKFIFFTNITVPGYYTAAFISVGATIAFGTCAYYANDFANAAGNLAQALATANGLTSWATTGTTETSPGTINVTGVTTSTGTGTSVYKSDSAYQMGVVFKDFAGRRCGVVTSNSNKLTIAERDYANSVQTSYIGWTLSNASALTEIPDWAYYYQIVRTKCLKTRFFLQGRSPILQYVLKSTAGVYTYQAAYTSSAYGIAIDGTLLAGYNIGYIFNEGDVAKIYLNSTATVYTLPVIGQEGAYIFVQLKDLGTFTGVNNPKAIFEIYTPYKQSITEPFYEVSQVYKVNNPTLSSRTYSSTGGVIDGDVYLINRVYNAETNKMEAMSPNDKFWTEWLTVANKGNFIDKIGQQLLSTTMQFSNTFIQGAKQNGLSTFDAFNRKSLDANVGQIQRLINTSKVQNQQGGVMLAVCELETASIYLGEVQLYGSNAPTTLTTTPSVIGTVNILKGNYGTVNPEGVVEYRGTVFIPDAINKVWVQYASNGLFPISDYKMVRFWNLFFTQYLSMTVAQIEALGGRPFVFATVDPLHKELLISIPKLLATPPKGYLPDYPSTIYPFDIWDGQGKTIVYKLGVDNNKPRWQGSYSFNPEGFIVCLNKLYSFKQGSLYLHNQSTNQNEFYGTQYKSRIMFISNKNPQVPKIYNNFNVQSNIVPTFVYFYNDYPYQQSSDLVDYSFNQLEGIWYSTLLRNKLVPTAAGFTTDGLLTGEKMRNVAMKILLEFSPTTTQLDLKFAEIGFIISKGNN